MRTNRWQVMASVIVACLVGTRLVAQNFGGGNFDPSQLQQMAAQFQERIAQIDPAQLQQMAARFQERISQIDPAQLQQMADQVQQTISQMDPEMLQQMADQWQQMAGDFGGNFDLSQLQGQRAASLREQLGIADDAEWSAVEALIKKVMDAKQAVQADQPRNAVGLNLGATSITDLINRAQRPQGSQNGALQRRTSLTKTSPEAETVRKAIDGKSSDEETKAALVKLMEARKAREAALEKAQLDLRTVLTLRQEAVATLNGLL
jgi:hypothetical protein